MMQSLPPIHPESLLAEIDLRLAFIGCPTAGAPSASVAKMAEPLFARHRENTGHLPNPLCPADQRIQSWLNRYLSGESSQPRLPATTLILDRPGLARGLSLPAEGDEFSSTLLKSYRLRQGILHNPANDRRTTQGVFHIAEGGLPIPDDKLAVPKSVFAQLLERALRPPGADCRLPFTANQKEPAECFVSLLQRPLVCPAVPSFLEEMRMEIRFFVPGGLVSNLDFVEAIFGNAGDPFLPLNDAALDAEHWTGHTGCIILAPHLTTVLKKEVGLPHWDQATERQRRDGMCWKEPSEKYNGGSAFKITARDAAGVIVTVIADNYYGYCKKEIKTQISFSANLFGLCEEEHAGGALVYPSYEREDSTPAPDASPKNLETVLKPWLERFTLQPEGHAIDRIIPAILLVPADAAFDLTKQKISWKDPQGKLTGIPLRAGKHYVRPDGSRIHLESVPGDNRSWRLVETVAEGTLCHKPSTVSGGGKSEISKAIDYAILRGHVFVSDLQSDFMAVEQILQADTSNRFSDPAANGKDRRPILSSERSIGSVIKLLTPSRRDYTDAYNAWLASIPPHIHELTLILKRSYKTAWGTDWRRHFSVDTIDGKPAYELKLEGRKLVMNHLRVGFGDDGSWRVFGLRPDFHPAAKVQMEDDITASVVAPREVLPAGSLLSRKTDEFLGATPAPPRGISVKIVENCEALLFQRPDDAVHRGYDQQAEADLASPGTFISNFQPLTQSDATALLDDAVGLNAFTLPMRKLIREAAGSSVPKYFVSSAHSRLVDGIPTKNPRYLQTRPDVSNPVGTYLASFCTRIHRGLGPHDTLITPVNVLAPGRRNNPPEKGIRPLAVFGPLHYLDLPELFMEYMSSMTGKSPSTTGAGSEGALTKGPFNALPPIIDLNAALVSLILTGHDAFLSAAGYVGPKMRVDHDVSLLIPEVFSRMNPAERDARALIAEGCLEKCADFTFEGKPVLASRLGYRITSRFVRLYFGRIFNHPNTVFPDEMLSPELQSLPIFADGMDNIVSTHQRIAESYFADGSIAWACPPLKALLHIMAYGHFENTKIDHPDFRQLFAKDTLLTSDWYSARLSAKEALDERRLRTNVAVLQKFLEERGSVDALTRATISQRLSTAQAQLEGRLALRGKSIFFGTIGVQPLP
jgi:phosphoenolpyruvate carboxykinase (diphosphate)